MEQGKARIFLAAQRSHTETEGFRRYAYLSGDDEHTSAEKVGFLYAFNDETLAGGHASTVVVRQSTLLFLIPVVGVVEYTDSEGRAYLLKAGQARTLPLHNGTTVSFSNPYEEGLINFFHCWFTHPAEGSSETFFSVHLECASNSLLPLFTSSHSRETVRCFAGKFDGRQEAELQPTTASSVWLALVVQGAFEINNRLLEGRDGLALWRPSRIEMEALSNEAIVLVIEMGNDKNGRENQAQEAGFSPL